MKKLLVVALSMFFTAGIFAGDAAYFVDEGFSSDGSVYVFGKGQWHGTQLLYSCGTVSGLFLFGLGR